MLCVDGPYKKKFEDVSAKLSALSAEHEETKKQLEKSRASESLAEKKLKVQTSDFEKAMAEKNKEVLKCAEAVKAVRVQLDEELREQDWIDIEILGRFLSCHCSDLHTISITNFLFPAETMCFPHEDTVKKARRNLYTRAGMTLRKLIQACRNIAKVMTIEDGDTCDAEALAEKMHKVPHFIEDWQKSSARGAARLALAMCLARNSDLDLDLVTSGVPIEANDEELLKTCMGYDNRIAESINHSDWFDQVVLEKDVPEPAGSEDYDGSSSSSSSEAEDGEETPKDDDTPSSPPKTAGSAAP